VLIFLSVKTSSNHTNLSRQGHKFSLPFIIFLM
jgi:hypothetical protein